MPEKEETDPYPSSLTKPSEKESQMEEMEELEEISSSNHIKVFMTCPT
jgi:hypothetical protein